MGGAADLTISRFSLISRYDMQSIGVSGSDRDSIIYCIVFLVWT